MIDAIRKAIQDVISEGKFPHEYIDYTFIDKMDSDIISSIFWQDKNNSNLELILDIAIKQNKTYVSIDFVKIIENIKGSSIKLLKKVFKL